MPKPQIKIKPVDDSLKHCLSVRGLDPAGKLIRCPHPPTVNLNNHGICSECFKRYQKDEEFRKEVDGLFFIEHLRSSDQSHLVPQVLKSMNLKDSLLCKSWPRGLTNSK